MLPIGIGNPVERVYAVRQRMNQLKGSYQPLLAFGVLARAAPALNPIQLGLPVSLLLGLFLLTLLVGEMGPPVQRLFDAAFQAAGAVTR